MNCRIWSLLLSLTLLTAVPALAKHRHADNSDPAAATDSQDNAASKKVSGSDSPTGTPVLDDLLDGKITQPKSAPSAAPVPVPVPAPLVDVKPDVDGAKDSEPAAAEQTEPMRSGLRYQRENDNSQDAEKSAPRTPLQATIQKQSLGAQVDGYDGAPMDGRMAPRPVLQGNASRSAGQLGLEQGDPDVADRELMVEWDRWRNRFLRAVQMQVQMGVNHPDFDEPVRPRFDPMTGMHLSRFPLGTETWFDCDITNDRRIKRLEIVKPSGIPAYDRAVIEGVRALEGTSILVFPRGSRRLSVNQEAGIRTSDRAEFQYHHFGDVERYRAPGP